MRRKITVICCLMALALVFSTQALAAETLFERAKNLYDVREYKLALVYFEKVIEGEPKNGEAWDFASWCHRYIGDWDAALKGFAKAKELLPGDLSKWVFVGEGETYLSAGLYEKAIKSFKEAVALAPDDEELVVRSSKGIAFAHAALGDKASVEQVVADLGKKFPKTEANIKDDIKKEAETLLLKAQKKAEVIKSSLGEAAAPALAEDEKITDASERLAQAVEVLTVTVPDEPAEAQPKPEEPAATEPEKPEETAPAAKSWQLPALGAAIGDVLSKLGEDGATASKADVQSNDGLWLYTLSYPSGTEIPDITGEKPNSRSCRIEEFDGKLLAVIIENGWVDVVNAVAFKDDLFSTTVAKMSAELGLEAQTREEALRDEAQWVTPDNKQVIALSITATLEDTVTAEKAFNDIEGLTAWMESMKADQ